MFLHTVLHLKYEVLITKVCDFGTDLNLIPDMHGTIPGEDEIQSAMATASFLLLCSYVLPTVA